MSYLKVKRLKKQAVLLSKRKEDAAYDIYWLFEQDYKLLNPWEIYMVPTWIAIQIPQDKVFFICERSSTWIKWLARRAWVVDSWYRWEIFVPINNTSNKPIVFYKNEEGLEAFLKENNLSKDNVTLYPQEKAIAQAMILHVPHIEVEEVDELSDSERWEWALWSTNK